jgi:esterase/lipase superfamily enzyme
MNLNSAQGVSRRWLAIHVLLVAIAWIATAAAPKPVSAQTAAPTAAISAPARGFPERLPGETSRALYDVKLDSGITARLPLYVEPGEWTVFVLPATAAATTTLRARAPDGSISCGGVIRGDFLVCSFQAATAGTYTAELSDRSPTAPVVELMVLRGTTAEPQVPTNSATAGPVRTGYSLVEVFYATNRTRQSAEEPARRFGSQHGPLQYGTCMVSIPDTHRVGELERPSVLRFEFDERPDRHVTLRQVRDLPSAAFWKSLEARARDAGRSATLIFIHGYNTTFEQAAWRTAQVIHDLRFRGAGVFFSWPSAGAAPAYTVDEASAERSQASLTRFFEEFANLAGQGEVYVVGHSMGTRILTQSLATAARSRPALASRVKEIVLTAPDIDSVVFKEQVVPALKALNAPITLYASQNDRALRASKVVHGASRAGAATDPVLVVDGVETIVASAVETDFLGHTYFASERSVLNDLFDLVNKGARPDQRFNLMRRSTPAGAYWEFRR